MEIHGHGRVAKRVHTVSPDTGLVSRAGGGGGRPHVHDCRVDVCCVRSISPPMIRAIGPYAAHSGSGAARGERTKSARSWAKGRPMKTSPPQSGGDSSPSWPSCPLLGALARAGRVVHRAPRSARKPECREKRLASWAWRRGSNRSSRVLHSPTCTCSLQLPTHVCTQVMCQPAQPHNLNWARATEAEAAV